MTLSWRIKLIYNKKTYPRKQYNDKTARSKEEGARVHTHTHACTHTHRLRQHKNWKGQHSESSSSNKAPPRASWLYRGIAHSTTEGRRNVGQHHLDWAIDQTVLEDRRTVRNCSLFFRTVQKFVLKFQKLFGISKKKTHVFKIWSWFFKKMSIFFIKLSKKIWDS